MSAHAENHALNADGRRTAAWHSILCGTDDGCLDSVHVEPCGLLVVAGWHRRSHLQGGDALRCFVNGKEARLSQWFRTYRPDVAAAIKSDNQFLGVVYYYRLPETEFVNWEEIRICLGEKTVFEGDAAVGIAAPHYGHLLESPEVAHREQIYGSGPPPVTVMEEILQLAKALAPPVLDFGCGSGVLVKALRDSGIEAYGLELDCPRIRGHLMPEAGPYVTLSDGTLPLAFRDGQFRSALAVEVLEHLPDYEAVLRELARVVTDRLVVTVPDAGAIPMGCHNQVVPWHLLEASHVNFFTQTSLEKTLKQSFRAVDIARIRPVGTNASQWFMHLVGMCGKQAHGEGHAKSPL